MSSNKKCRLCLSAEYTADLYTDWKTDIMLKRALEDLFNINDKNNNDELPQSICINCEEKITVFHHYYMDVMRNQGMLFLQQSEEHNTGKKPTDENGKSKVQNNSNQENNITDKAKNLKPKRFKCNVCSNTFCSNSSLKRHKEKFHKIFKKSELNRNGKSSSTSSSVLKSPSPQCMQTKNNDFFYKLECVRCNEPKQFNSMMELENHQKNEHLTTELRLKCSCNSILVPKFHDSHLLYHSTPSEPGIYACLYCNKRFKNVSNYKQHFDNCSNVNGNLKCNICNKYYTDMDGLRKHKKIQHSNLSSNLCDICGNEFKTKESLRKHFRNIHAKSKTEVSKIMNPL